jgi:hypothetical protein
MLSGAQRFGHEFHRTLRKESFSGMRLLRRGMNQGRMAYSVVGSGTFRGAS